MVFITICSINCIEVHEKVSELPVPQNHRPEDVANNYTEVDAKVFVVTSTQSPITLKNAKSVVEIQKMENEFKARVV